MEPNSKRARVSLEPHLEKRIHETTPSGREFVVSEPSISEKFSQQLKQHNSNYEKLMRLQAQERIDQNIAFKELQTLSFFPKNIEKQELKNILLAVQSFPPHLESLLLDFIDKFSNDEHRSDFPDSQREDIKYSSQENQQSAAPWISILENLFHARVEVEHILGLIYLLQQQLSSDSRSSSISSIIPSSSSSNGNTISTTSTTTTPNTNNNNNNMNASSSSTATQQQQQQTALATSNVTKSIPTVSGFHADLAIRYLSKHQELKKASESLYESRDRISAIIARENVYFEELQAIRNNGWNLSNKPFSSSSSTNTTTTTHTSSSLSSSTLISRSSGISGTTGKPVGKIFLDLSMRSAGSKHSIDVEIYQLQESLAFTHLMDPISHVPHPISDSNESKILSKMSNLIGYRINSMADIFTSGNSIEANVSSSNFNDRSNERVSIFDSLSECLDITDFKFNVKKVKSTNMLDQLESAQLSLFIWELFKQLTEEVIDSNLSFLNASSSSTASSTSASSSSVVSPVISSTSNISSIGNTSSSSSENLELNRKVIESRVELKSSTHIQMHVDLYSSKEKNSFLSLKLVKSESASASTSDSMMDISDPIQLKDRYHTLMHSPKLQIEIITPPLFHSLQSDLLSILLFQSTRLIHKNLLLSMGTKNSPPVVTSNTMDSSKIVEETSRNYTVLDKIIIASEHILLCSQIDFHLHSISSILPNSFYHWNFHLITSSLHRSSKKKFPKDIQLSKPFVSNFHFHFGKRLVFDVTVTHSKIILQKKIASFDRNLNSSLHNKRVHNSFHSANVPLNAIPSSSTENSNTTSNTSELWNITPTELAKYILNQVVSHLIDSICEEASFISNNLKDPLHFRRDSLFVELYNSWRSVTVEAAVENFEIQIRIIDKTITANLHRRATHLPIRTYVISLTKKETPLSEFSAIDDWIDRLIAIVIHSKFY